MRKFVLGLIMLVNASLGMGQNTPELHSLQKELATAPHDTAKLRIYTAICRQYSNQKNSDSILFYANKAKVLAKKYRNSPYLPKLWGLMGNAYRFKYQENPTTPLKQHYDSLIKYYYRKSMKEATRLNNDEYYTRSWFNICSHYADFDSTFQFFKNTLTFIEFINNKPHLTPLDSTLLIQSHMHILTFLIHDTQAKVYGDYLDKLVKLTQINTPLYNSIQTKIFSYHASIYNKKQEALLLSEYNTIKKLKDFDNYFYEPVEWYLAEYYYRQGNFKKSLHVVSEKYDYRLVNEPQLIQRDASKYLTIGKNMFMLKQNNDAIKYLEKSRIGIENFPISMTDEKYEVYLYLSKAYQLKKDYEKAYKYANLASESYQKLNDIQLKSLLATNEVNLEKEKQDKRIKEIQTKILLKEQEVKIEQRQKSLLLTLFIVSVLITAYSVYLYLGKKRLNTHLEKKQLIIAKQAHQLDESNRLKDKIFALLSHELRSPITRIVQALQLGKTNENSFLNEFYHLQTILNNVLLWSSMQIRGLKPLKNSVHIQSLVDSLIAEANTSIKDKQVNVINTITGESYVQTDENYLRIVIRNILNNAIKFSYPEHFIRISFSINDVNKGVITITDTGKGIEAEQLPNLFFYPSSTLGTHLEKGSGLGLSLSFELLKQLGGQLRIESKVNMGTKVIAEFDIV